MEDLDLSTHSLNNSASKQRYSFPRSQRFSEINKPLCDSIYNIPNALTKRATSLGYGQKTMGLLQKHIVPGVGNYNLSGDFNPQNPVKLSKGWSFGEGREEMEITGPLKEVRYLKHIPGPGKYESKNVRDYRGSAIRSRLPDRSLQMIAKNPGPGAYNTQSMGTSNYYLNSKFKNYTNVKISQVSRLDSIAVNKRSSVGPADYITPDQLNKSGHYQLAKHQSVNAVIFGKANRKGILEQGSLLSPGPDADELIFRATPQLRKNVALFNSDVEVQAWSINFDEITGLYENKQGLLVLELETQGTRVKIGQVQLNLGAILNQKKYRVVNSYPLAKCYDKTAKVKISVDFVPINAGQSDKREGREGKQVREIKQERQYERRQVIRQASDNTVGWKSGLKSRLAQESNVILQQKIYEYEQKLDNYRLSQNQLQERLHEQIQAKDQKISELVGEVTRRGQQLAALGVQNQQNKSRVRQISQQNSNLKEQNRGLHLLVESLRQQSDVFRRQLEASRNSLENMIRAKESKEKHMSLQISKYTSRYLESEQERNKIIFQLEGRFKEEMQKKDYGYRQMVTLSEKKHTDILTALREKVKGLENICTDREDKITSLESQLFKSKTQIQVLQRTSSQKIKKIAQLEEQLEQVKHKLSHANSELQTLNFSYQQIQRQINQRKEEANIQKKMGQQLRMELMLANQTIEEHRKSLSKMSKQLQVHQEREYYLAEKYNDDMEMKSIHQENIRGQTNYYRQEIYRLKGVLRITEERVQDEGRKLREVQETATRVGKDVSIKNGQILQLGEEKILLQSQNKRLKGQLAEREQALILLKEENQNLNQCLAEKRAAMDTDRSIELSYKIQQLQHDISQMVEKFKIEKDLMRDNFRREEVKRKEEITSLETLAKRLKQQNLELKQLLTRKDISIKEAERNVLEVKNQLKNRVSEINQLRDRGASWNSQRLEMQRKANLLQSSLIKKGEQHEKAHTKESKLLKKAQADKSALIKLLENVIGYLIKPTNSIISFQEINHMDVQPDTLNFVNLGIKKFCDEHNKRRQQLKKIQQQALKNSANPLDKQHKDDKQFQKFRDRRLIKQEESYRNKSYVNLGSQYLSLKQIGIHDLRDQSQLQILRSQNGKLKKQIAQLRVKVKGLEEEVSKNQKNIDTNKYDYEGIKNQLEDAHDEATKLSLQLKRREKIITQYEKQIHELQAQIINLRNNQVNIAPKQNFSRADIKLKQKQEGIHASRDVIVIKELEGRLNTKEKQIESLQSENDKLKAEISNLREALSNSNNQLKVLQARVKEKTGKLIALEKSTAQFKTNIQRQKQIQQGKQLRTLEVLNQELQERQSLEKRNNQVILGLQKLIQDLELKLKLFSQTSRSNEIKLRREYESAVAILKQSVNQGETKILELKSQFEESERKVGELNTKIAVLQSNMNKRGEENVRIYSNFTQRNKEYQNLQEQFLQYRRESEGKLSFLSQKIQELQSALMSKDYELQEYKFSAEGRVMELERHLEQISSTVSKRHP